jgi:DNA invertase Pin-like site-specific DNA recombinase
MAGGARLAYIRVSTAEQNEARQTEALKAYDIGKWYVEKASGKDLNRPVLKAMLDYAREGDTVYVHDFSRLARSTKDLLGLVEKLNNKGIHLISVKESFDTGTATGKLMLTVIAAINEFERLNLLERQREGIKLAALRGAYKGRKPVAVKDFGRHYDRYKSREISKAALARELGISRPTLDRLIQEYVNNKKC